MRKAIVTVVALVLVVGLIYFGYTAYVGDRTSEEQNLRTVVVSRGDLVVSVSATGSVAPESQVNLSFGMMGEVDEVLVEEGQTVEAGQLLARLDTEQLEFALLAAENNLLIQQVIRDEALAGADEHDLAIAQADLSIAQTGLAQLLDGADEREVEMAWRAVEQAKNTLWKAQVYRDSLGAAGALRKQAEADVANAEAAVRLAELQYEQVLEGASEEDVDIVRAQVSQAQARLDKMRAGVSEDVRRRLDAQVAAAQIQVDQARARLADAELYAPFDGVVAAVNVEKNEMSPTGLPAFVLVDISRFHVDVDVDEVDVAQLADGQTVEVTLDALPDVVLNGTVERIAPAAGASVSAGGVAVTSAGVVSYKVTITLDPTEAPVRAGMSANASITVERLADVLLAPTWVVRIDRRTGQPYVQRLVGGQTERVDIQLGVRGNGVVQVLGGLEEGDVLVLMQEDVMEAIREEMR
ncbi:MAG: efflux RND transporter periplasmic adaptor subunit [Chloroflexota bacterium]|nr:efflux RND transporter periplasmic adaptor subunit [Chloroflexota bacterium]